MMYAIMKGIIIIIMPLQILPSYTHKHTRIHSLNNFNIIEIRLIHFNDHVSSIPVFCDVVNAALH